MLQGISADLKDNLRVCRAIETGTYQVHLTIKQGANWYSLEYRGITIHPTTTYHTG